MCAGEHGEGKMEKRKRLAEEMLHKVLGPVKVPMLDALMCMPAVVCRCTMCHDVPLVVD